MSGEAAPPETGTVQTLKMPVSFEEKRIFDSSAENEAPRILVLAMNCSIAYCFEGRGGPGAAASAAAATRPARHPARNAPSRSGAQDFVFREAAGSVSVS